MISYVLDVSVFGDIKAAVQTRGESKKINAESNTIQKIGTV